MPTSALEWRRALVYTGKFGNPDSFDCAEGYRIAVSFKELVGPEEELTGFNDIYERITAIARARINQLTCACGERPHAGIRRQGWCRFGVTCDIAIAFALWELACPKEDGHLVSEPTPTAEDLSKPREATLEVSAPFSLENADEIYNAVDFARDSSPSVGLMSLSYGERVPTAEVADFGPFVERAESMLKLCAMALHHPNTVAGPPSPVRRAWYCMGPPNLVTVEVHFQI